MSSSPLGIPPDQQALTGFLIIYNHHRTHSALGGQPPITRLVTHLCGKVCVVGVSDHRLVKWLGIADAAVCERLGHA